MKTTITILLFAATALWAQADVYHPACTNATLNGYYGFTITGTRPSAPTPGAAVETVVGVAMTHFYGDGTLTQTDNIHGSITGLVTPDRPGTGTYALNDDCTGTMTLMNEGAPPLTLKIVVVDDGLEVRTAVVNPTATVTPGAIPPQPQVMVTSNGRRTKRLH